MACCATGGPTASKEDIQRNRDIERELQKERQQNASQVKLLLLGTGESGKSTIAKQMKIIHLNGFSEDEKAGTKQIIYHNIVTAMKTLVYAARDTNTELLPQNKEAADALTGEEYFSGPLPPPLAGYVKSLWKDPAIHALCERGSEFNVIDSAQYFFNDLDRITGPEYFPTDQDMLRARSKTTGVKETQFTVQRFKFRLVDVGGQRSERRKWAQCFEDVTAVLFCIALSEYDMHLAEDSTQNRMHESLVIYKELLQNKWFVNTPIITFFNKRDIFAEKIQKVDLTVCFPDYKGGRSYEKGVEYIQQQFLSMNENPRKAIYTHVTCATDTDNIIVVFTAVRDIVVSKALTVTGLMT